MSKSGLAFTDSGGQLDLDRATLVVTAPSARLEEFPLGQDVDRLAGRYRVVIVSLRDTRTPNSQYDVLTLEDLGLPGPSLRFALADPDLTSLVKPFALSHIRDADTPSELIYVDGACLLAQPDPIFQQPMGQFGMEIVPALPLDMGRAKTDLVTAMGAGLGRPARSVIRLAGGNQLDGFLDDWRHWILHMYVTDPTQSLTVAEEQWLAAAPGARPEIGWSHEPVVSHWSDLQQGVETRLVDTSGFHDYRGSSGPAYALMERHTHSAGAIEDLTRRVVSPWVEQQMEWGSGQPVTPLARDILRAVDPMGSRWPDPTDDGDGDSFREWLLRVDSRGWPRFAQALYWARPDLQDAFPPRRTPVDDFVHWTALNSITVDGEDTARFSSRGLIGTGLRLAGKKVGLVPNSLASPRESPPGSHGVNLVGFASAETGLGEAMRGTLVALRTSGREPVVLDLSGRIFVRRRAWSDEREHPVGTPMDVTIFHLNPTELMDYGRDTLAYRVAGDRNIGFFFWETEHVPESWQRGCDMVDEIWVASTYLERAFRRVTSKPIHVMGMAVEAPVPVEADRGRYGIGSEDFVVSYVTDAYSGLERKDPMRAIDAFELAYGNDFDGAHLLLKIGNLEKFPDLMGRLYARISDKPITVVPTYLNRQDLWRFLACSDVYLSLHSSEGFGLTILEAMALGVPPVVTAYGGNMDFTNAQNSMLLGYGKKAATGGPGNIYDGSGSWADPNLEEAAGHLRRLKSDQALLRLLGEEARAKAAEFSMDHYTRRVGSRLAALDVL